MEKERGAKLIAIIALVIGVVGLSVGFAAFAKDLNITFEQSTVSVGGTLNVKLIASENTEDTTTSVVGTATGDGASALPATISGDTITGLGATFTGKGQSVEYLFYVYNYDQYDAYLTGVKFENYGTETENKVCTAVEGTTQTLVDDSCLDISLTIDVAGTTAIDTDTSSFTTSKLSATDVTPVKVTITYNSGENTHELPNGDFKINFGAIKLSYSSVPGTTTE